MIWYAFVPGIDTARAEELIMSESLPFTTAFRRDTRLNRASVQLGERGATRLSLAGETRRFRRLFLVPFPAGVLFVQCLTMGTMEDEQLCAAEHPELAAQLVRAFEAAPEGLARARLRARCEGPPGAGSPRPTAP
jgi:hypothetical protein